MKVRHVIAHVSLIGTLSIAGLAPAPALAQPAKGREPGPSVHRHRAPTGDLVKAVRAATERFRDVAVAEAEGYALMFGCVSGSEWGAMGLHYVNLQLVADDVLDPSRPEIVIYEPLPDGRKRLVGADFLVFADVWHAGNRQDTPQIMGQLLHRFDSPNRYGLPAFYTLHVWAWKDNPNGSFVNWHPDVSCDAFRAPAP